MGGTLPSELGSIGIPPGDVDHVIITHTHPDHIGWSTVMATDGFSPRFPNATYYVHEADWVRAKSFEEDEDRREFQEVLAPLEDSGQLELSPEDGDVLPGLRLLHTPGHTPGHRCVLLDAGHERVLFAGDLLHFTFQLNDVDFGSPADENPVEGSRTRAAWLDRVEREGLTLATAHVPPSPIAGLVTEDGVRVLRPR